MGENERNFGQPQWTRGCRDCSKTIGFREDAKSYAGFLIPLNLSGTRHNCENSDYVRRQKQAEGGFSNEERLVLDAIARVAEINDKLQTCQLRLVREPRNGQRSLQ